MTPEQRKWTIIGLAGAILLIVLLLLWWLLGRQDAEPEPEVDPAAVPSQELRDTTQDTPAVVPVTPGEAGAQTVSRNFAERYGTYSTDVAFTNISEVRELTTPEFYASLQSQVYELPDGADYQGRTTRAISTQLVSGTEASGSMQYRVTVQHEATTSDRSASQVSYQTALVNTELRGSAWLVSGFTWE